MAKVTALFDGQDNGMCDPPSGKGIDHRSLLEQVQAAIFVVEEDRFTYVNARLCELFGYSRSEMLMAMDPMDLVVPEDRPRLQRQRELRVRGVAGQPCDVHCVRRDGTVFCARIHGSMIGMAGRPAHLVTLHDVSELKEATRAAEQRSDLLAETERLASIGSSEFDIATGRVTQSAGMFRIFGEEDAATSVDGEWLMQRVPANEAAAVRSILTGVTPGRPCEFEHRIVRKDGSVGTVLHRAMVHVDARNRPVRVVGLLQDITAQRAAEHRLLLRERQDEVTGLPNRAALLDALDGAARQARRENIQLALLVLEIDQVKVVSDSLGYAMADRLLEAAGSRLSACLSGSALLAHLGSGEFVVMVGPDVHVGAPAACALATSLVEALAPPFVLGTTEVQASCAIGVTTFPRDGDDAGRLLHQGRAAKQRAREVGDNRVAVYSPHTHARSALRFETESALRHALRKGQLELHYQPQVDLSTGAVVGAEALLRWNHPKRGMVSPLEFIPIAEETGIIVPIGEWVLRTACAQNRAWQLDGLPPIRVAVNLSVRQLEQPDIARRIHSVLQETGMDPRHLGLEVTESMLVHESAHVSRVLGELKELGIEISLDDFGTGYSNLGYLRQLPIDVVKVDRSLVHDVTALPDDVSMTRAVITLAHSLKMKVLAEGVETEGQLELLMANRCDQIQGYFFSRPLDAAAMGNLLRTGRCIPRRRVADR